MGRVVIFNAQDTKVPANFLKLPDRDLETHDNRWLLQLKADTNELLADGLLEGWKLNRLLWKEILRQRSRRPRLITEAI